jgi:hypothetical protein
MTLNSLFQNHKRKEDGKKIKRNLTRDDEGSIDWRMAEPKKDGV